MAVVSVLRQYSDFPVVKLVKKVYHADPRYVHTSSSLAFSPKAGLIGCGAMVGVCAETAMSVISRNGFLETGRPFVVGLGSAGLGGPFRFRKGLLERRGEGPRSERRSKGVSLCTDSRLGLGNELTVNWVPAGSET